MYCNIEIVWRGVVPDNTSGSAASRAFSLVMEPAPEPMVCEPHLALPAPAAENVSPMSAAQGQPAAATDNLPMPAAHAPPAAVSQDAPAVVSAIRSIGVVSPAASAGGEFFVDAASATADSAIGSSSAAALLPSAGSKRPADNSSFAAAGVLAKSARPGATDDGTHAATPDAAVPQRISLLLSGVSRGGSPMSGGSGAGGGSVAAAGSGNAGKPRGGASKKADGTTAGKGGRSGPGSKGGKGDGKSTPSQTPAATSVASGTGKASAKSSGGKASAGKGSGGAGKGNSRTDCDGSERAPKKEGSGEEKAAASRGMPALRKVTAPPLPFWKPWP